MNLFDPKNNLGWRDYLTILWRRKWYFIVPFCLVLPVGVYKITSTVPIYESTCMIQVQPSNLQLVPNSLKSSLPGVSRDAFSIRKSITNQEYLNELIKRLDLEKNPSLKARAKAMQKSFPDKSLDEIIEILVFQMLKGSLKVRHLGPDIISIRAVSVNPEMAYSLVKTLSEIYINDYLERALGSLQGAMSFNDEQMAIYKAKLEDAEKRLENFKRHLITNKVENEAMSVESLQRIHNALVAIEIASKEKNEYLDYLNSKLTDGSVVETYTNTLISNHQGEIDDRIKQMGELMKRFSWKSPEVINANRKINDEREEIKNEADIFLKEKYPDMVAQDRNLFLEKAVTIVDIEIQHRKAVELQRLISSFRDEQSKDPAEEMTLAKLEADVVVNRKVYNSFLQQNQGVQIEERMARSDASDRFKILNPPNRPLEPINAGFRMILMVTLIGALGLGGGVVVVREYLDNSIRSVAEAEDYFDLSVIGILPNLRNEIKVFPTRKVMIMSGAIVLVLIFAVIMMRIFDLNPLNFLNIK